MAEKEYIEREAFVEQKREQYCKDCARRKGMRNGKYKTLYEIGEAPCRACGIDDVLNDVEDFPATDVRPVVRGKWIEFPAALAYKDAYCDTHIVCSACEAVFDIMDNDTERFNFCPNCGADMRNLQSDSTNANNSEPIANSTAEEGE